MLEIGVQTKGILPEMDIDKGFRLISEAGFSRVDINIDTFLKNNDLYAGKVNKSLMHQWRNCMRILDSIRRL